MIMTPTSHGSNVKKKDAVAGFLIVAKQLSTDDADKINADEKEDKREQFVYDNIITS